MIYEGRLFDGEMISKELSMFPRGETLELTRERYEEYQRVSQDYHQKLGLRPSAKLQKLKEQRYGKGAVFFRGKLVRMIQEEKAAGVFNS